MYVAVEIVAKDGAFQPVKRQTNEILKRLIQQHDALLNGKLLKLLQSMYVRSVVVERLKDI